VLAAAYHERGSPLLEQACKTAHIVGITSNTVPWELLRAAGCVPVLVSPHAGPTPHADQFMEPSFDPRIRQILESTVAGKAAALSHIIIPRTSAAEYRLYLYLREVARQKHTASPAYLFDLLHTRSPRTRAYGMGRLIALKTALEEWTGKPITAAALESAIAESNAARRAIRTLLRLRRGARPRLKGSEAVMLIGAWNFMDRGEYAILLNRAISEIPRRPALAGPRILIKGFPLDHPHLHHAVESHGAVVVAEDDWWGSRAAGAAIRTDCDPLEAIFAKYYLDAPSPQVFPLQAADRWFEREVRLDVDGVVFYLPCYDDVYGWDNPRQRQFLDRHRIPHVLLRQHDKAHVSAQLEPFLADLKRPHGVA
jgi:benzoyl-CoA reductase/2-hydroxyglutaryl-CoA dehydratase subunit BcrC/BadD/HgdB